MLDDSLELERLDRAQALLESFEERLAAGEPLAFADLIAAHPELATELRDLRAAYEEVEHGFAEQAERAQESRREIEKLLADIGADTGFSGRYMLEGEVGHGGMGAVLRVRDRKLDRSLAMKVILAQAEATRSGKAPPVSPHQLRRLLNEARITGQLDHPGIVPVHEVGVDERGRAYFTMKLVKGRTLAELFELNRRKDPEWATARVLAALQRVCEALAFAHERGVIHRDLKPSNVMVGDFGEVYVMDWGLARRLDGGAEHPEDHVATDEELSAQVTLTRQGRIVGTPCYMSPEQARGEIARMGSASDVYSIGAMLYELAAGAPPYTRRGERISSDEILARIEAGPPEPLASRDLAPEFAAIIEKAMSYEAGSRYPSVREFQDDLERFLQGRSVRALETGAWVEFVKWVQRNKPLSSTLAAAVLLLAGGLVTSLIFRARAEENLFLANHRAEETAEQARIAEEQAVRADEQERIATQRADEVLSLSASKDLKDLIARADTLWPPYPELLDDYERWLNDAHELIDGRPGDPEHGVKKRPGLADYKAKLAELRSKALPGTNDGGALEDKEIAPSDPPDDLHSYYFADSDTRWWYEQLSMLVADLETFADPVRGLIGNTLAEPFGWGISKRSEFARTIAEESIDGLDAKYLWSEAIAAIATSTKYDGLTLTPQMGFLPIGPDRDSGLWEFAHIPTGEIAKRGADGKLVLTENTGLVFVLIPGGTFWMGAQKDPHVQNYDPSAEDDESPVHEVTLAAYLASKYEMTQGQWQRLAGQNPSFYDRERFPTNSNAEGRPWSPLQPVEQVSWSECVHLLARVALALPTEAQWEYACRAGTASSFWSGEEGPELGQIANISDLFAKENGGGQFGQWSPWYDGNVCHAAVGSYRANGFGLHDVHGNVWEWCLDSGVHYSYPTAPGNGLRSDSRLGTRIYRGGGMRDAAWYARSANRNASSPERRGSDLGLRPASMLRP